MDAAIPWSVQKRDVHSSFPTCASRWCTHRFSSPDRDRVCVVQPSEIFTQNGIWCTFGLCLGCCKTNKHRYRNTVKRACCICWAFVLGIEGAPWSSSRNHCTISKSKPKSMKRRHTRCICLEKKRLKLKRRNNNRSSIGVTYPFNWGLKYLYAQPQTILDAPRPYACVRARDRTRTCPFTCCGLWNAPWMMIS